MSSDSSGMMPRAFNWSNKPTTYLMMDVPLAEPWVLLTCANTACRVHAVAVSVEVFDTLAAEDFGPLECTCCSGSLSNPAVQSAIIGTQSLPSTHDPVMIMPALASTWYYTSQYLPHSPSVPSYHSDSVSFLLKATDCPSSR